MKHFYISTQPLTNGDHEIHRDGCSFFSLGSSKYLGFFDSCADALREALKNYPTANGCRHCAIGCYTARPRTDLT